MNTFSIVLSLLTVCVYSVQSLDKCSQPPLQANFNLTLYLKTWNQIESYPNPFQEGLNCVTAKYEFNTNSTDTEVLITNSGFNTTNNEEVIMNGKAKVMDASNPANISVDFGQGTFEGQYWVIATDYDKYSLVYSCRWVQGNITESAWILSTEKSIDESLIEELKNNLTALTNTDITQFVETNQEQCSGAAQATLSLSLIGLIYLILKITV